MTEIFEHYRQFRDTQLSIACLPVFSQSLLPKACKRFLLDYPEVNFTITSQESPILEELLSAQYYDIGLTETSADTHRHLLVIF
ncbi:LysR substrate-binding domain-containing protein [Candidatus Arsenophonus triatominarum]|uniref:LysR substrate-binding domain-containing protein n=1 Tax=Candidatus Arsenophonus triatominarum TaxID=57911 RepID=UPI0009408E5E|nr:LysR substrate-binding domain-containing protein [Candidatus Arsenophonus triatominarum]